MFRKTSVFDVLQYLTVLACRQEGLPD